MPIEAASSIRAAAAAERETARAYRAEVASKNAEWRRDQRISEAKASAAARPTPADRAAATPTRAPAATSAIFVDVVA
jgi:hypothetical protein